MPDLALGSHRDAIALGLDPEQAAERGGDADRAAAVGAQGDADHAGGHGGGRPAARAAGRVVQRPGVARGAEGQGLREREDRQLGHVRLADDDGARFTQRAHDVGVALARAAVRQRAPRRDLAGDVRVVLDRHRHTEQRAPIARAATRIGLVGLGQGAVGEHHAEGVQLRVRLPDAVERRLDELARRDLAGGHQARLLGGAGEAEVGGVHGAGEH